MTALRPPRLAIWLLERFHIDEALIGDVIEEYRQNRSRVAFWVQTLAAVARTSAGDVRGHAWLTARAVVVGWLAAAVMASAGRLAILRMEGPWTWSTDTWLHEQLGFQAIPISFLIVALATAAVTGWIVGRLHRPYGMSMVLAYVAFRVVFGFAGFLMSFERGLRSFGAVGLAVNTGVALLLTTMFVVLGGLAASRSQRVQPIS
jgi:hypothetical protein